MFRITQARWLEEFRERGPAREVKFKCPSCGHPQSIGDYEALGIPRKQWERVIAFSCIGRSMPDEVPIAEFGESPGPCNYAGGGLLRIAPVCVVLPDGSERPTFDFAENPLAETIVPASTGKASGNH